MILYNIYTHVLHFETMSIYNKSIYNRSISRLRKIGAECDERVVNNNINIRGEKLNTETINKILELLRNSNSDCDDDDDLGQLDKIRKRLLKKLDALRSIVGTDFNDMISNDEVLIDSSKTIKGLEKIEKYVDSILKKSKRSEEKLTKKKATTEKTKKPVKTKLENQKKSGNDNEKVIDLTQSI
jgi:hypothetical protein